MKLRKLAMGALVLLLAFVTACGGGNGNNEGSQTSTGGNNNDGSTGKSEERITLSFMQPLHGSETPDPKIEELIEEKLNVNLEIQWIPATTYIDRMNAAFATGNLPTVANISPDNKDAFRDGQFWEIGPYLDQFENLKNLKESILNNLKIDGKLYSLYQGRPLSRQGLIYRKDWADNLGLSTPTNIDELYEMLKQFTENDPDGNGVHDTIGLADRGDLNSGAFKTIASWFGAPNEWGFKDGELKPWFMFDEYVDAMNFMRDLRENGYINLDFPVTSKVDQQNMLKNGTAGGYIGCMCDVQPIYNDAVQLNPNVEFDVQNKIAGPSGEFTVWAIPGYNHPYTFPKSMIKTEEELLKVLDIMDKMMSAEISNLLFWGIEGEHYTVEDGKAVPIEDQAKLEREVKPYNTLEVGEPDTNGRLLGSVPYAAAEKANELFVDNDNYLVHNPTLTLDSPTFTQMRDRLDQIMTDATYNYMLGSIDEAGFQQAIDRWLAEGGQDVIDEFNASYNESQ